ncbi:hypothetical protein TcasGA2_TC001176 [Tribolium castaneum]|uniref:Uncharacterized protein n=1 Tax=Tribolium castaneum TaxID=7070 RepID=D6WAL6_TRICA|nr:hypothetical protein TcasGA2_TC001176 [Tribolium castaneum]
MVQSAVCDPISSKVAEASWGQSSKKSSFESFSKKDNGHKTDKKDNQYGAWGSVFKNKDHFASLHHC